MSPVETPPSPTLWRHREFRNLWAGQTVSQFGSQVTQLAVPLIAALTLDASPLQMGMLWAAYTAPALLLGLVAGVSVDRRRRRPTLIATDLLRALVLLAIPAAALLGFLRIELLYLTALLTGALSLLFDVAYGSYLPSLVARDRLPEGNAKLETSRVLARIAGPGLAGLLVRWLTGPIAIAVDAASYLVSAAFLDRIASPEPAPRPPAAGESVRAAVRDGLHAVGRDPVLLDTTLSAALWNVSDSIIVAVYVLFATRELGLGAGAVGLVFAAGNAGGVLGALLGARTASRLGPGPTVVRGALLGAVGILLVPLAAGPPPVAAGVLVVAQVLASASLSIGIVTVASVRQAIVPDHLLGRVNATVRFATWGLLPLGSLLGGLLGGLLGLRPTLAVGALLAIAAFVAVWRSPVRALTTLSHPAGAPRDGVPPRRPTPA